MNTKPDIALLSIAQTPSKLDSMTTTMAFEVLNYLVPSFLFLLMEEAINTMFIFSIKVLLPIKKKKKVEEAIN